MKQPELGNSLAIAKEWGYKTGEVIIRGTRRFLPEIIGLSITVLGGEIGRTIFYTLHKDLIDNFRQNINIVGIIKQPFEAYIVLNETHPLLARALEISTGLGIAQLDSMKNYFGQRKQYVS